MIDEDLQPKVYRVIDEFIASWEDDREIATEGEIEQITEEVVALCRTVIADDIEAAAGTGRPDDVQVGLLAAARIARGETS